MPATTFRKFVFENRNSINVSLTLEAPVGTQVLNTNVGPNTSINLEPNVNDVQTAKVIVVAQGHEGFEDVETFELRGQPFPMYIETLTAQASIGSIHGVVSATF